MKFLQNVWYDFTYHQAPAVNTMAASPSRMRSPFPRVRSPCGRARTRTVGWMTTMIPHQGPNSTTPPEWKPPPATSAANAATSASSPRTLAPQILMTLSQASKAAAAVAPPRSPAGDAKDKASTPKKTVYQTWRMWLWGAPGGTGIRQLWMRQARVEEGQRRWLMAGQRTK